MEQLGGFNAEEMGDEAGNNNIAAIENLLREMTPEVNATLCLRI